MNKNDYTLRIARATPVQLVIINHEILIDFAEDAVAAFEAGDTEEFFRNVNKAKDALMQLTAGLDFKNDVAQDLYTLYLYAGERLNKAFFGKNADAAREVAEIFKTMLAGWRAIENTPDSRVPPAGEEPLVYAGLTYGRGGLSEYAPGNEGGGFKA